MWSQKKQYWLFTKNSNAVEAYQFNKLKNYIAKNKETTFGKYHQFGSIKNYKDFVNTVPVSKYSYFQNYINQIAEGESNCLTQEKVIRFEETSGTTTFAKLIPYTKTLLTEFQSAIACWMYALYKQNPIVFNGKAYWSISPATRQQRKTKGGINIGVADDAAYFNPFANLLLNEILVAPRNLSKLHAKDFYINSIAYLLAEESLSFISAWSPSFLLAFDDFLKKNTYEILTSNIFKKIASTKRQDYLKQVLKDEFSWNLLWRNLSIVSCWTDAQAYQQSKLLQKRLGNIKIQGKGLLSTEFVCSFPLSNKHYPALSYLSHFYEFRSLLNDEILLAHQLEKGKIYEIVVTTGGGLYRYATSDLIEVTGQFNQVPCFKFVGRKNKQSDLVGEKITEFQINNAINTLLKNQLDEVEWVFVATEKTNGSFYNYVLNIELKEASALNVCEQKIDQFENLLFANPYYKEAVELGQLKPLCLHFLDKGKRNKYLTHLKKNNNGKEAVIKNRTLLSFKEYKLIQNL